MIRTGIGFVAIVAAILWCPLWVQLVLFGMGVWFLRYQIVLLVPAIISDVIYAPSTHVALKHFKMTLVVGAMLIIWYVIMTQTRIGHHYAPTTK